jgi:hypothetical protein
LAYEFGVRAGNDARDSPKKVAASGGNMVIRDEIQLL